MTAKEKLRKTVEAFSEEQAEDALRLLRARQDDPMMRRLDEAPLEDEEISAEEEAGVQDARDELAAGKSTIPLEEVKRKHGLG